MNLPKTLKEGANSIHALGQLEPSEGEFIDGDVFVPNGDAQRNNEISSCSDYAEYFVYDVDPPVFLEIKKGALKRFRGVCIIQKRRYIYLWTP